MPRSAAPSRSLPNGCGTTLRALLAALVTALLGGSLITGAGATPVVASPQVRVVGNQLVDGDGAPVRLLGVNKSGGEFACVQGWGFFDGPVDDATVSTIRSWGANAVRVPLNEQCWLGINGLSTTYSGQPYRDAVAAWVGRLNAAGMIAILDLHWSAPGTTQASSQQVMADSDHAADFWRSVAGRFVSNLSVVFDLYNEPHDISWPCWRDGCTTSAGWQAAGMQSLVDAVRSTGAQQPLLVSGLNWAGDLSQWTAYAPHDPLGQLVAAAHIYNFSQCGTATCWDQTIGATARSVPVVTTEVGEDDCAGAFVASYLDWADAHGVGYTAWTWNTWGCSGPSLIIAYDGTPTAEGAVVQQRLRTAAAATAQPATPTPTPTPTPTAAPTSTTVYGFESTLRPWRAESTVVSVARSAAYPYRGSDDLLAARTVPAGTWSAIRVNTAGTPLRESWGRSLTAWVRLDSATPGSWTADLEVQDSAWRWVAGPAVTLVPGTWVKVAFLVPSTTWSGNRALGLQVAGSRSSAGSVTVRLDEVRQTTT